MAKCANAHQRQMDHFLNQILPDEKKTEAWLRGQIS